MAGKNYTTDNHIDLVSSKDKTSRRFVLSVMEIGTGVLSKKIVQDAFDTFDVLKNYNISDEASTFSSTVDDFFSKMGVLGKDMETMLLQRADNPISDFKKVDFFFLPLPTSIDESFRQNFTETHFSLEEKLYKNGIGALKSVMSSIKVVGSGLSALFDDIVSLTETYFKRNNFTVNPNTIHTYEGSEPRTINLEFMLIPDNATHAQAIKDVIAKLKRYSRAEMLQKTINPPATDNKSSSTQNQNPSPGLAGATQSPELSQNLNGNVQTQATGFSANFINQKYLLTFEFSVDYNKPEERENFHKLNSVMSSKRLNSTINQPIEKELKGEPQVSSGYFLDRVDVVYGNDGNMALYEDGMPKYIKLTLSLIERFPMWSQNFAYNYSALHEGSTQPISGKCDMTGDNQ